MGLLRKRAGNTTSPKLTPSGLPCRPRPSRCSIRPCLRRKRRLSERMGFGVINKVYIVSDAPEQQVPTAAATVNSVWCRVQTGFRPAPKHGDARSLVVEMVHWMLCPD